MKMFFYCQKCGCYESFDYDNTDIRPDAERHCGDCGAKMITRCPNTECPQWIIEDLSRKFCPCGTELPRIEIAYQRFIDNHRVKPRPF